MPLLAAVAAAHGWPAVALLIFALPLTAGALARLLAARPAEAAEAD